MRRRGQLIERRPATDADVAFLDATYPARGELELTDVIRCDGVDVGFVVVEDHGDLWWIEMIAIAPAHRGKGIGTAVLEELIEDAPVPLQLSVLRANPRARALYERLGFQVISEDDERLRMSIRPLR